ncbi:MAG: CrcB family protein [Microbacteriaceae bacterium]|nr:CrcB family protein [Microbacteriaceae bacterium]
MNPFDPMLLLGITLLGGLGSAIRVLFSKWDGYMPWGILTANVLASFIAGFGVAYFTEETQVALVVIGLAGGLSTFSSWAAASVQMAALDRKLAPVLYTIFTLVFSSTAAYFGLLLG